MSDLLKPDNMLRLYASGAFPMADEKTGTINWYMPEMRAIIPIANYNVPRSIKKFLAGGKFIIKTDTSFEEVLHGCADRPSTWISEKLIEAYKKLYKRGHLHTVEAWKEDQLVGGLYGITFRGVFFGESMFSRVSQASKTALIYLLRHLKEKNYLLLDVQYMTEHLKMFGAVEVSFDEYTKMLYEAYTRGCEF